MAVEIFSWPSLHERMCRTWGSNSGPLACQADTLPIELQSYAIWPLSIPSPKYMYLKAKDCPCCMKLFFLRPICCGFSFSQLRSISIALWMYVNLGFQWEKCVLFCFSFNWVLRPVKIISLILSWVNCKVGAKTGDPWEKPLDNPQEELGLSHTCPELGLKPQGWDDERFTALKISILDHSATGAARKCMLEKHTKCRVVWMQCKLHRIIWAAPSEFGTYRLCEQRRFRRACTSAQSRQNLPCSLIQAVSQEEPSDRKPDPWSLWMAGHAQLKFVMMECSKTQIRLTRPIWWYQVFLLSWR